MAADLNQPIVIDNGSGIIKAGHAGGQEPKAIFPAFVGRPKHVRAMAGGSTEEDFFVGKEAEKRRGILRLNYPMEHGVTTDWADMESVWNHVYSELNIAQKDQHPVLLTEAPLNPRANRRQACEIFFEVFSAPAMYVQMQAILSLYASGRVTGVVLDSGDGVSHAVPVYEGFALPHAISRIDVAGRDVTDYLQLLLRKAGYPFHTTSEREVIKAMKERMCYVTTSGVENMELGREEDEQEVPYKLPDGNVIHVNRERFLAPEVLFDPSLIGSEYLGVQHCVLNSINKADLDIRRTLYQEIVLAGGSTMFVGFADRLLSEMRRQSPHDVKLRIYAPKSRNISTWVGGSILASLNTFSKMWISKKEWAEMGPSVVFRKTF